MSAVDLETAVFAGVVLVEIQHFGAWAFRV